MSKIGRRWRICRRALLVIVGVVLLVPLFLRVQAVFRESGSNKTEAPSSGRFVRATDVEIFIQEKGSPSDPAVLLMHGTGAWSETWQRTLNTLAGAHFHAIAMDAPPFGYSSRPKDSSYSRAIQADRILGVMDALRLEKVIFVGHSFGARATITAALKAPHRVRKLVLVDAALGLSDGSQQGAQISNDPSLVTRMLGVPWLRNILVSSTFGNPLLTRKFIELFVYDPATVTDEILRTYQRPMNLKGNTENVGKWLHDFLTADDSALQRDVEDFGRLNIQTSLIWGEKDSITPLWQAEALHKMIPNSTVRTIQGVGHIPHLEASAAFMKILLEEI